MNTDIAQAVDRARQLLAEGSLAESLREYEAILERDPVHVEALNAVGMWAARGGNLDRGLRMIEAAAALAPDDPLTLHNLAQVYQASGAHDSALQTYRRVLRVKPDLYVARLAAAHLLEQIGRGAAALPVYFRAVADAQRDGRWLSPQSTARNLQPAVEHAFRTIDAGRSRLYHAVVDSWVSRFGESEMKRVRRCVRMYLGEERMVWQDERQRSTFLHFPDLPASPYIDKRLVPQIRLLEARWHEVRAELQRCMAAARGRETVFLDAEVEAENLRGYRGRPQWDGYYFERHGEQREENRNACPVTSSLLEQLPTCRIRGHAPETLFSVLSPGTHLLPHRGITNTRIVGHLALIIPEDCALQVADVSYSWREGEVVLFDDTYLHEAWNRSAEIRVVLIFDLWNPHLSEAERLVVADLVGAIGDFHAAADTF